MTRLHEAMARAEESRAAGGVRRFTRAETWVHRSLAWLMGICVFTAVCLYFPPLAEIVGRRRLVVTIHEWSGIALPVPPLLGLASRAFRRDAGRLGRFFPHDWSWLKIALRRRRREPNLAGKFNAGQKLYAAFTVGSILLMVGTGLIMWFPRLTPLVWRTGATFVHDWLFLLIIVAITGHVRFAAQDPEARRGLRTGYVTRWWADREHWLWRTEQDQPVKKARPQQKQPPVA
ncbi:cytochrome b/b6 domain-containing protein [Streptomyces sp. NBC_01476]|uniref:cytochrome b/b6 domain-containing protein n=1 Tax=Streptomyces sp. NBC_01476 TaxID=2903881 RepID=UPI002E311DCD|nr:cytochrome b/b6 domain-containing protein [Streptomyces sp. NBC_01476]